MTPWILGYPVALLVLIVAVLFWENHRHRITDSLDRIGEGIREVFEDMGRVP